MSTESEQTLENNLITQLETLGWAKVTIADEAALLVNLKKQLEIHGAEMGSVQFFMHSQGTLDE